MSTTFLYIVRFFVIILVQGLIVGQIEFGTGIHPMIYPLIVLMLPFETAPILLMVVGFLSGLSVDFLMNTFGMHASAGVLVAYIRPELYRLFAPRDGYDMMSQPIAKDMGYKWFLSVYGIAIVLHHLWFFILEYFNWSLWMHILKKTLLSSIITLVIFILIQILFFSKSRRL